MELQISIVWKCLQSVVDQCWFRECHLSSPSLWLNPNPFISCDVIIIQQGRQMALMLVGPNGRKP